MAAKREHPKTFAEIVSEVPESLSSPYEMSSMNVVAHREWLDPSGKRWRMRGDVLDRKHARRILAQPDVRIAHFDCYGPDAVVTGAERTDLIDRVRAFLDDVYEGGGNGFGLAEFRDDDGNVILVVEGDCC